MTHDFRIETSDTGLIVGELLLDGPNQPAKVKITSVIDVSVSDLKMLTSFIEQVVLICRSCGAIQKIQIIEK